MQKMKLDHFLILYKTINSKWIKHLNVRPKTTNLLEENIGSKSFDIALNNIFQGISPEAREGKEKKQMGLFQTKRFLHSKGNHQQNEKTTY